jgi:hypothetical protein
MNIRFNLSRGPNYKKWSIKDGLNKQYICPSNAFIKLYDCVLHNNKNMAQKIHKGAPRNVCGWIRAKSLEMPPIDENSAHWIEIPLFYDPKIAPNWRGIHGEDLDNYFFPLIIIRKRSVNGIIQV